MFKIDTVFLAIRLLLTLVFAAAGGAKLLGVEMMVDIFQTIGWGQWFRYVTAIVELGSTVLLWVPGVQIVGSVSLMITMVCGALFHVFVLGPSAMPALVLAAFSGLMAFSYRDQAKALLKNSKIKD